MKLFSDAPQASMKMSDDPVLITAMESAFRSYGTRVVIETGTFEGTGSTRIIAECLRRVGNPITYVTMEVSFNSWCIAYRNLRQFIFVDCRWGCSVDREGAIEFIRKDDAIRNHHLYSDIYIDDTEDPVEFYSNEMNGMLSMSSQIAKTDILARTSFIERFKKWGKTSAVSPDRRGPDLKTQLWGGESLLPQLLRLHHDNRPLVVLDSAGGCGLYEFQIMMDVMRDAPFLLLLDDIHHLKHFRSLEQVGADSRFKLLNVSKYHGWALAWHE